VLARAGAVRCSGLATVRQGVLRARDRAASLNAMATTNPPAERSNGQQVRRLFDRLNAGNVDALRDCWTSDTVERFPDATLRGADAIAGYLKAALAALPDWHIHIERLVEQDDDVFVHRQLTGTHDGAPFQGVAPTGRRIVLDGMDHFVLRDGAIVSNFVVFDQMQFARAVDLLPPDRSPADRALKAAFNAKTRLARRLRR